MLVLNGFSTFSVSNFKFVVKITLQKMKLNPFFFNFHFFVSSSSSATTLRIHAAVTRSTVYRRPYVDFLGRKDIFYDLSIDSWIPQSLSVDSWVSCGLLIGSCFSSSLSIDSWVFYSLSLESWTFESLSIDGWITCGLRELVFFRPQHGQLVC